MKILEENEWFLFWEEDAIMCYLYKKPEIDLDIAKMSVAIRLRLTQNRPCKLLADLKNLKVISKEYYASTEGTYLLEAVATIAPSFLARTIVTFFLNFNKPKLPFQIFSNKTKALDWLIKVKS